ncbi:MAG: hypothetical protein V4438_01315 [Patescibacteria group bacterium]
MEDLYEKLPPLVIIPLDEFCGKYDEPVSDPELLGTHGSRADSRRSLVRRNRDAEFAAEQMIKGAYEKIK